MSPEVKSLIDFYRSKGFLNSFVFDGEYVLMINPKTLDKVRVYDNGQVWVANPKTGDYVKESGE